jgi:hypothetical protein
MMLPAIAMGANTFAMPRSIKSRENNKTGDKRATAVLGRRGPWLLLTCAAIAAPKESCS